MTLTTIQQGRVDTTVENGIATITFSHPKSNSLPGNLLGRLAQTITQLGGNRAAKVIVLQSAGEKAFCAGASFDELLSIADFKTGKEFFMGFARVINAARVCPKFIVARVQGKAVGGGVGLASVADYTLALSKAAVKLSELAIGIGPFVVGPAVERKIGTAAFGQLAIAAKEWKSAQWAKEKGLYAEVYSSPEALDEAVNQLATELAQSNPEAMQMLKENFWAGTDHWTHLLEERAEISGRLVLSEFTTTAIGRFKAGAR